MTDEQIDEMYPGRELDYATNMAVFGCDVPVNGDGTKFLPSTSWDDAIHVATQSGLFGKSCMWGGKHPNLWTVWKLGEIRDPITIGPPLSVGTGPVAICRAILKLANKTN
jgi:hypothetical protein